MLLLLNPSADSDFDGAARVLVGEAPDPGPAASQFLAVLNRHDHLDGGPNEFTRALLTQLAEWALGKRQPGEPEPVAG
ncbi:hypothetical protein ACFY00_37540 [Kitasatospora sp. NPDC001540]|uniref:hypothetical protein n=1 Tax=Kitasatospora sp. NPDC001540 TaxID=3364014 RepID=UPI0036892C1C